MFTISRRHFGAFGMASVLSRASAATSDKWPSRPIKLIVPFPPGGGNDSIARLIAEKMGQELGQPIVIDNRGGAGGMIGVEAGLASLPDGYTLTMISPSYAINPAIYKLKFDAVRDQTPIIQISSGGLVLIAHPKVPFNDLRSMIQYVKSRGGQLNFASAGQGGITHLAAELLAHKLGIRMTHIPYKGGGPALNDLLAGQVDVMFSVVPAAKGMIDTGRVKAIAVSTSRPIAVLPNVATASAAAHIDYDVQLWHGLIGPKGLPDHITSACNKAINALLSLPEASARLATDGVTAAGGTSSAFGSLIASEIRQWQSLVRETNVKLN